MTTESDVIAEAKAVVRSHEVFAASNDLDGVMSNVADDVVFLAYGLPLIEGKAAFHKAYGEIMATGRQKFGHEYTGEESIGPDVVILRGVSKGSVFGEDGTVSEFSNNFIHILRRASDGQFKIWRASAAPNEPVSLLGN